METGSHKCFKCGKIKPADQFSPIRGRHRPHSWCKLCRREKRMAKLHPKPCPTCNRHRKLDRNGKCQRCNRELGLKQCARCNQLLPALISFYAGEATCRDCR